MSAGAARSLLGAGGTFFGAVFLGGLALAAAGTRGIVEALPGVALSVSFATWRVSLSAGPCSKWYAW
jgi:hypothetical protein